VAREWPADPLDPQLSDLMNAAARVARAGSTHRVGLR